MLIKRTNHGIQVSPNVKNNFLLFYYLVEINELTNYFCRGLNQSLALHACLSNIYSFLIFLILGLSKGKLVKSRILTRLNRYHSNQAALNACYTYMSQVKYQLLSMIENSYSKKVVVKRRSLPRRAHTSFASQSLRSCYLINLIPANSY